MIVMSAETPDGIQRVDRADLGRPVSLEGFWPLQHELVLHAELLGERVPAKVLGLDCEFHPPLLGPSRRGPRVAATGERWVG